ncbi:MAG: family 78 glycoside hydrolase catalytic domain, partial [Christensenellales bacterium]
MFQIQSFTCEGLRDHLVTDCAAPTFAYFVSSDRAGASVQSAELTVNGWTIRNPDQCGTRYAGQPLKPFTTYTATLTVTSDSGETDTARLTFETGRMDTPWQGKWITDGAYVFKEKKVSPVPMVFRKALPLRGEIAQAKLYATAMGIYELNIDGQKVGERYFAPGFTSYAHQLMYQTYDVTDMMHSGSCITATVAGGWAVGSFVFTRVNRVTADRQALLAELRITYRDGRTEVIGTDESWQVTEDGPVRMADFYDGETYDVTVELDKANWRSAVQERLRVKPKLMADYGADVKEHETFAPVSCKKLGNALIYDFGQNFAGVVRLTVTGKRGQKITIRHSEVLNPDGTLNTAFLRTAKATATYICKDGKQTWSPRLTYMGFRYISVEGVREENVQVTGVMLYSDIQQTGSFRCSNEMLNRLQENIVRSAKSNFMDIPTDCPQRDERMGWTGDIAVFAPTAAFNFDMNRFLDKWLLDVQAEQLPTGGLPNTVPVQGYGFPATM